jgi:hypothetical protein
VDALWLTYQWTTTGEGEMSDTVDTDEHGRPVAERYERLGASGNSEGVYVRFEPGFGLNVHIGFRYRHYDTRQGRAAEPTDHERCAMGIDGWERLCELVDEYREREKRFAS